MGNTTFASILLADGLKFSSKWNNFQFFVVIEMK